MDFFETINTRKTIRKYKSDMPNMEDIKKIIDAARLAPSATNSQNWQFIVIKNKELIEQIDINIMFRDEGKFSKLKSKIEQYLLFLKGFDSEKMLLRCSKK